jgi:ubiquinone/menaquinone biosynthesis C-methylase UbiE
MRIHLGCGDKRWPGFVNVDLHDDPIMGPPDVKSDVRKLSFPDNHADEMYAIHLFEHIARLEADVTLSEWRRVLKVGGKLVIEVPCLDKIAQNIVNGEKNLRLTVLGLFGDPNESKPDMMHGWCYSKQEITTMLEGVGFRSVEVMEPKFHMEKRDMRVEAVK